MKPRHNTRIPYIWLPQKMLDLPLKQPSRILEMRTPALSFALQNIHMKLTLSIISGAGHYTSQVCLAKLRTYLRSRASRADELAPEVEFLSLFDCSLGDGNLVGMPVLEEANNDILSTNNVVNVKGNRKTQTHTN